MNWPALTALEFDAVCTVTAVLLIALAGGLAWLILRVLPRKWRENEQLITAPPGDDCLYCRGLYMNTGCTCTRRCTAMVCIAPPAAAEGAGR